MRAAPAFGLLGAMSGFAGVAAGAFGAHALRTAIPPERLQVFETAARYQLIHALALLLVALALGSGRAPSRLLIGAGSLFTAGQIVFSGSLYLLALTRHSAWGAVTPIGGLCHLAGWIVLGLALARMR